MSSLFYFFFILWILLISSSNNTLLFFNFRFSYSMTYLLSLMFRTLYANISVSNLLSFCILIFFIYGSQSRFNSFVETRINDTFLDKILSKNNFIFAFDLGFIRWKSSMMRIVFYVKIFSKSYKTGIFAFFAYFLI